MTLIGKHDREMVLQQMRELAHTLKPEQPLPHGYVWEKIHGCWTIYHMPSGTSVHWGGGMWHRE